MEHNKAQIKYWCDQQMVWFTADPDDLRILETDRGIIINVKCGCSEVGHDIAYFVNEEATENFEKTMDEIITGNSEVEDAYDLANILLAFLAKEVPDNSFDKFVNENKELICRFHKAYYKHKEGEGNGRD